MRRKSVAAPERSTVAFRWLIPLVAAPGWRTCSAASLSATQRCQSSSPAPADSPRSGPTVSWGLQALIGSYLLRSHRRLTSSHPPVRAVDVIFEPDMLEGEGRRARPLRVKRHRRVGLLTVGQEPSRPTNSILVARANRDPLRGGEGENADWLSTARGQSDTARERGPRLQHVFHRRMRRCFYRADPIDSFSINRLWITCSGQVALKPEDSGDDVNVRETLIGLSTVIGETVGALGSRLRPELVPAQSVWIGDSLA